MSDEQQRREDAWAVMKQMHDDLSKPAELRAADGWCAPSTAIYEPAWQVGTYQIKNAAGEVVVSYP